MKNTSTHLLIMFLALCILSACSTNENAGAEDLRPPLVIKNNNSSELVETLTLLINEQRREDRLLLYTKESRESVLYNDELGIGSAGTLDEIILEEIFHQRDASGGARIVIERQNVNSLLLTWPSGRQSTVIIKKSEEGFLLDLLKSPGGDILLLRE